MMSHGCKRLGVAEVARREEEVKRVEFKQSRDKGKREKKGKKKKKKIIV